MLFLFTFGDADALARDAAASNGKRERHSLRVANRVCTTDAQPVASSCRNNGVRSAVRDRAFGSPASSFSDCSIVLASEASLAIMTLSWSTLNRVLIDSTNGVGELIPTVGRQSAAISLSSMRVSNRIIPPSDTATLEQLRGRGRSCPSGRSRTWRRNTRLPVEQAPAQFRRVRRLQNDPPTKCNASASRYTPACLRPLLEKDAGSVALLERI